MENIMDKMENIMNEYERRKKIAFDFYKWREAVEDLAKREINDLLWCNDDPNDMNNYSNLPPEEKVHFEKLWREGQTKKKR